MIIIDELVAQSAWPGQTALGRTIGTEHVTNNGFESLPSVVVGVVEHLQNHSLTKAVRGMRDLTPEQREDLINSDRYKSMFSDHERELLSGAARLPLAPGDSVGPADTPDR